MRNELIHKKFRRRAERLEIADNLYKDADFSEYYRLIVEQDSLLENDLDIYKRYFDKKMPILEIGSGTGRIFNRLFQEGYDVYGIEPFTEMSRYIDESGRDRIYSLTVQEIEFLPKHNIEIIIIPATSVSLFNHSDLESLLEYLKRQQPFIKKIIFDFLKEDFFLDSMDIIQSHIVGLEKFYYVNFFDKSREKIIYNLVNSEKLGISVKYVHSHKSVKTLFEKMGMSFNIISDSDCYTMVEGVFHENK